jgi:hypothetical protein
MTAVLRVMNDEISKLYIAHKPDLSGCVRTTQAANGSMTFVHRFNSALERSPHLHVILPMVCGDAKMASEGNY